MPKPNEVFKIFVKDISDGQVTLSVRVRIERRKGIKKEIVWSYSDDLVAGVGTDIVVTDREPHNSNLTEIPSDLVDSVEQTMTTITLKNMLWDSLHKMLGVDDDEDSDDY